MPSIKFTMPKVPRSNALNAGKVFSLPKPPKISMAAPKMTSVLKAKPFDFSKLSNAPKLPKSPKVKILKLAIKKLKK